MPVGLIPRMDSQCIGSLRVDSLVDAVSPARTLGEMLRGLPPTINPQEPRPRWAQPNYVEPASGKLILAYQSFVIQTRGLTILVDCAVGEDGNFPLRPDWHRSKSNWLNHLGQAGLAPEDIDIVFLTHLHMDHTGWLTRNHDGAWLPTFPNARHLVSETELDFWRDGANAQEYMSSSIVDCVEPVAAAGLFETILPGEGIAPELFVVDLAGHSPGMIGLEHRQDDRVLASFCADLMHHPVQMAHPELATIFCSDPDAAVEVRRRKLAEYAQDGTLVFCGHFPGNSAVMTRQSGSGFTTEARTDKQAEDASL